MLPEADEQHLVAHVVEPVTHDPTIKKWKAVLVEEQGSIFWDSLYQSDQLNRVVNQLETTVETAVPQPQAEESQQRYTAVPQPQAEGSPPRHEDDQQYHNSPLPDTLTQNMNPAHEELRNVGGSGDTLFQEENEEHRDKENEEEEREAGEHEDDEGNGGRKEDMNEMNEENLRRSKRLRIKPNRLSPSLIKPSK